MAKRKEVKLINVDDSSAIISNKKPGNLDYILLFLIAAPFILLILFGNENTKSSNPSSQGLSNSWQNVSPAFSNKSAAPQVAPSPDKIIPTFPLSTTGKLQ